MDSRIENINSVIENYLTMVNEADHSKIPSIFHPEAHLYSLNDGKLIDWDQTVYIEGMKTRTSPKSLGVPRNGRVILSMNLSDNLAFYSVEIEVADRIFFDHLTFMQIGGSWKIIAKAFDFKLK